ncbi:MAG: hypothetical protein KDB14_31840, partial [Planctomycetales bacterium]|nr:hypothetical protein [Planctomycetales bacterium]
TGREVRFGDRAAISAIVDRTMEQGGGVRTLLHETVGSPLFTGGGKPIARPANLAAVAPQRTIQQRMMMTSELADIASPALRPETPAAEVPPPAAIDDSHRIELQVTGLFMPECVAKLRETIQQLPEAKLLEVDFETARARIAYAAESELLRGAKPEQIIERLDNRVRQLSGHTLSLKQPGNLARDRQERIEIGIVGLDCMACSLAVHDMLIRIEGVEQVQASFRDGMAVSWIDPTKTNRAALEELLRMRGVQLREP